MRKWVQVLFVCLLSVVSSANTSADSTLSHKAYFDDSSLDQLLKANKKGVIYIVSPYMPLSEKGIHSLKQLSLELGFKLTVLSDPHLPKHLKIYSELRSKMLLDMGALNHYPSTFYYKNGSLLPLIIPGYKNLNESRELINKYLTHNFSFTSRLQMFAALKPSKKTYILNKSVAVPLNFLPSFFFRMSPDAQYVVGYNSSDTLWENFLVKVNPLPPLDYRPIPGGPDAVFLGSQDWVVTTGGGVNIYPISNLLKDQQDTDAIFSDDELNGVYQSVGILSEDNDQQIIRIILGSFYKYELKDYIYNKHDSSFSSYSKLQRFCANKNFKLPIISKDGRELAGYDLDTQSAVIYKIEADMSCSVQKNLSRTTGKISFSYDQEWIAFHISSDTDNDTDFISIPDSSYTADIYLYHRPSDQTFQITSHKNANALYPDFLADGSLVFIEYPHGEEYSTIFRVEAEEIKSLIAQ